MKLLANSIHPNDVTKETRDGQEWYIVEDVPFVRSMNLHGGYVPSQEIKANTDKWENEPLTVNHPRNRPQDPWYSPNHPTYDDGDFVPVDFHPLIEDKLVIGNAENPRFDGTWSRADFAINADKARNLGGHAKDIIDKIDEGEAFNVSSQYFPGEQYPPGEYDGEIRSNVNGIGDTDCIALLPHRPGRCSLSDGCGINPDPQMVANAEVQVPYADDGEIPEDFGTTQSTMRGNQDTEYALIDLTPDDDPEYTDSEWDSGDVEANLPNPSESDENADVLDSVYMLHPTDEEARDSKANWKLPFRSGPDEPVNTRALVTMKTGRGIPALEGVSDADKEGARERVEDFLEDAPDDMFGAAGDDDMSGNTIERFINSVADMFGSNDGAESSTTNSTMKDEDKIDFIAANSDYDRENLEAWDGTDCLSNLYQTVKGNTESENESTETEPEEVVMTESELEEMIETKAQEVAANQQEASEKEELASEIVANSAEYDDADSVTEDFPTVASLKTKKEQVTDTTVMPGSGATPNANEESDFGTGEVL
jgi:hypothetical protein